METAKRLLPMFVIGMAGIALLGYGRIPQAANYHAFADTRALWGVANAGNVLSNAGFLLVGAWAIGFIARRRQNLRYLVPALALFAVALILTSLGSGYYHLAPSNERLLWDRLPLAMACGSLLAAAYIRTHETHLTLTLPMAATVFGIATVLWWSLTEARGVGDLRPYILLQGAPLLVIPLWQWRARSPRRERIDFGLAVLLYVLAKLAELGDRAIFDALGVASGHTLKHLLAAAASFLIVRSLAAPVPREA
ncbi:MAG TPA: alkaline phytoceramidase [Usitatibacter sp.]|nr:alkaline phytoceramidase [Usitatibacter sp.]